MAIIALLNTRLLSRGCYDNSKTEQKIVAIYFHVGYAIYNTERGNKKMKISVQFDSTEYVIAVH